MGSSSRPVLAKADWSDDGDAPHKDEFLLSNWFVTDLSLDVMNRHNGGAVSELQQWGVTVCEADVLKLSVHPTFRTRWPSLIVMSNLCPPTQFRDYLGHLLKTYAKFNANGCDRRQYYSAICYEAVLGQMEAATVVSITRCSDQLVPGQTPSEISRMRPVPNYQPQACNHAPEEALFPIANGHKLQVQVNHGGPLDPRDFLKLGGQFDLVEMCATATALGMRVLFLAEWDAALSHSCARCVRQMQSLGMIPPLEYKKPASILPRSLGGWADRADLYPNFIEYAEARRREECLAHLAEFCERNGLSGIPIGWPPKDALYPHAYLNAAVMWFFSDVCEVE